ncbi:hypothetical protein [Bifidobacterium adolescentis]|uniref:hypothetical protein n=1 Tax=Bifidobacterium adolescentis TaxID=1680 RepID=UPI0022E22F9F|nr:hypothetical protein [Bifidobacterium adolescentis]
MNEKVLRSTSFLPSVSTTSRIFPLRQASSCAPWITWPAKGDVATPSLMKPMMSERPRANPRASAL